MAVKHSKQREMIYAFLKTRKDHPTADVVYENVRMERPNISLGTVYRNLTLLADMGQIILMRISPHIIILSVRNVERLLIWKWKALKTFWIQPEQTLTEPSKVM